MAGVWTSVFCLPAIVRCRSTLGISFMGGKTVVCFFREREREESQINSYFK